MASLIYSNFKTELGKKTMDMINDVIKVALVTSSYTASAAHSTFSDITNEVSGTGYSAGGATLGSKTFGTVAAGTFDGADVTWTTSTLTAAAAVIYNTSVSNKLIAYIDFGGNYTTVGGTLQITWNASGIITLT